MNDNTNNSQGYRNGGIIENNNNNNILINCYDAENNKGTTGKFQSTQPSSFDSKNSLTCR